MFMLMFNWENIDPLVFREGSPTLKHKTHGIQQWNAWGEIQHDISPFRHSLRWRKKGVTHELRSSSDGAFFSPGKSASPQAMATHNDLPNLDIQQFAMENGPFIDGLPIKNGDFPWLC